MRVGQPGGVRSRQTSIIDSQSFPPACPESTHPGSASRRILFAWIRPTRLRRVAIAFKPSTFLNFHRAMVQRKYRSLFSPTLERKPGPKGPTADLIQAVVEMKRRNSTWGCPQIAEQINLAFGTCINKDVVRRILVKHYPPTSTEDGPSWLTFIGHMKDSLWSLDLFRCESASCAGTGCSSSWTTARVASWALVGTPSAAPCAGRHSHRRYSMLTSLASPDRPPALPARVYACCKRRSGRKAPRSGARQNAAAHPRTHRPAL